MMEDSGRRRTMLKDGSWIRRDVEEDEAVDYDPNFGKSILGRLKSTDDSDSPPVNSGTSVNSLTKQFGDSQALNKSSISTTTKSSVTPRKPPVPVKNPAVKTSPNTSSFTARVFSGANTSNKTVNSPVKRSFGEKSPEVTVSQTINRVEKNPSPAPVPPVILPPPPPPVSSVTSTSSSMKEMIVKTPVSPSPVKSPSRYENASYSQESPTSSVTTTKRIISSSSSSSLIMDETQSKKTPESSENFKLSDVSYSSTRTTPSSESLSTTYYSSQRSSAPLDDLSDTLIPSRSGSVYSQSSPSHDVSYSSTRTTPSSESLSTTYYSSQRSSAPLDDLSDTLIPSRSGSVYSQSSPSQSHMMSVDQSHSSVYSPSKSSSSEFTSSRTVSTRDVCSVCGKPTPGSAKMILEDLQISCHTSCFKCAVCHTALGNLEIGKSLWVYRDRVNCSNCYNKIKGQWYN
ncbi:sciellin [Triplophysa dalaica]|uniref:sciellin n=1 Tax=Triplophysa dalaica TaxID=1582913 RepID=UPI0024DF71C6|nr:sciellin [Triplophysa dalaica]